jgi:hypothetical protein
MIREMTLENIIVKDTVKRSEIDVITYSRAVQKKALSDTIANILVSDVYKLLNQFKPFVAAFLWFNRILQEAMEKLHQQQRQHCADRSTKSSLQMVHKTLRQSFEN